jgi:hypothetical protein
LAPGFHVPLRLSIILKNLFKQADADNDKMGDECDPDADNDGIPNK